MHVELYNVIVNKKAAKVIFKLNKISVQYLALFSKGCSKFAVCCYKDCLRQSGSSFFKLWQIVLMITDCEFQLQSYQSYK